MTLLFTLVTGLIFLVGGIASAQSTGAPHHADTTAVPAPLACSLTIREGSTGEAVVISQVALNFNNPSFLRRIPEQQVELPIWGRVEDSLTQAKERARTARSSSTRSMIPRAMR